MSKRSYILIWIAAIAGWFCLTAMNLWFGELNQDEGWYLYAARLVADGQWPYRDFAFTQPPLLAWVYSLFWPLIDSGGLLAGRLLTALMGFAGVMLASGLAAGLAPPGRRAPAATMALVLTAVNVYHSYFTTVVKTYSLCAVFLTAGLLCLAAAGKRPRRMLFVSGILLALAAGTRLSAGIALPVVFVMLLWRDRATGWGGAAAFAAGGALTLAAVFLPLLYAAPEALRFNLIEYHAAREAGTALNQMMLKAGFLSRFVRAYFVLAGCALALLTARCCGFRGGESAIADDSRRGTPAMVWAVIAAVSALHISAAFPYDDYQVIVMPAAAAAVSAWTVGLFWPGQGGGSAPLRVRWFMWTLLLLAAAAAGSSVRNQDWVIRGRELIWWRTKEEADLVRFRRVGSWLRERLEPGDELLTQDVYLAVESKSRVPPGMSMGPFSYYPDWPRERAEALHVLNREMLLEVIAAGPRWAAFSEYGLSISCPRVEELDPGHRAELRQRLLEYYEPVKDVPYFGQALTRLTIYRRRMIDGDRRQ